MIQNKKAIEMGMTEIIGLIIGAIVLILVAVYMIKGQIYEGTLNNYNLIMDAGNNLNGKSNMSTKEKSELVVALKKTDENKACKKTSISELEPEFINKIKYIAKKYGATETNLLKVIAFESGHTFCSCAVNEKSGATGLIQFMPDVAAELGTTSIKLCKMTRVEQLDYVEKYFDKKDKNQKLDSLEDLYMSILWPRAVGENKDYEILGDTKKQYEQNKGLDGSIDKKVDGKITVAEATNAVYKATKYIS